MEFNENLLILVDEIHLAKKWERASIIYTIHKDVFSQQKTKEALNKRLSGLNINVVEIQINKVEENFIEYLMRYQKDKNTVFYISNLDWGGGKDNKDCYRILNLHRETFIEQKIMAIFFLSLNEAANLPHLAPDFWAFRHLVLEFSSTRPINKKKPPVGIMLWQLEPAIIHKNYLETRISNLRQIINGVPEHSDAVAMRIDLQYELAYLIWIKGDLPETEKILRNGLEIARTHRINNAIKNFVLGLAIVNYERENYQEVIELLDPFVKENPRDCLVLINQAIAMFALNQRYLAINKGIRANKLCSQNAWLESSLGFLYFFAGKMDEALICFKNAVQISPKNAYFYEALVVSYLGKGDNDKANELLAQAKNYASERRFRHKILKACIDEEREKALKLINDAIIAGKLSTTVFNQDPILYALFNHKEVSQSSFHNQLSGTKTG